MADTVTEKSTGPFTPEQLASARQVYEGLSTLFSPEDRESHKREPKTGAEVGDRALTMLQEGASKTVEMLGHGAAQIAAIAEQASPVIWKIMVKQQIASAIANLAGPIMMLIGCFIFHIVTSVAYGEQTDPVMLQWKAGVSLVLPIIMSGIAAFWLITATMDSIQYLFNPEYYAARDLIDMITGRRR